MGEDENRSTDESFYHSPLADRKDDTAAIDSLIHQRPQILRVKLAVLATQIQERLAVRTTNLARISEEMLAVSTELLRFKEWPPLYRLQDEASKRFWIEAQSKLFVESRVQDVEAWRDVAEAMNDFLVVWEGVEQSRVRGEFLREQRKEDAQ